MAGTDNRVEGIQGGAYLAGLTGAALRQAVAFVVTGRPAGAALLSAPTTSTFRAWTWVFQLALGLVLVGVVIAAAFEDGLAPWIGGAFALVGLLGLGLAFVVCAAVERTVPPPRHVVSPAGDPFRPADAQTPLLAVGDGVWVAQTPLRFYGLCIGARMTVMDTGDGLVVYSPIDADESVLAAVRALGTVRWIVAPNMLHHLFVALWHEAFPEAELWCAPELKERRADLPWTGVLHTADDAPWSRDAVDLVVVPGHALLTEVVLFHRPTRTLAVADLIQDLGHDPEHLTSNQRLFLELGMAMQRPSPPVDYKLDVSDPAALRAAVSQVLRWDLGTIVLAHGPMVRERAWAVFADAFAFVR